MAGVALLDDLIDGLAGVSRDAANHGGANDQVHAVFFGVTQNAARRGRHRGGGRAFSVDADLGFRRLQGVEGALGGADDLGLGFDGIQIEGLGSVQVGQAVARSVQVILSLHDAVGEGVFHFGGVPWRLREVGGSGLLALGHVPPPHFGLLAKGQGHDFFRHLHRLGDRERGRVCRDRDQRGLEQFLFEIALAGVGFAGVDWLGLFRHEPDRHRAQDALLDQPDQFVDAGASAARRQIEPAHQLAALDAKVGPAANRVIVRVAEQRDGVALERRQVPALCHNRVAVAVNRGIGQDELHPIAATGRSLADKRHLSLQISRSCRRCRQGVPRRRPLRPPGPSPAQSPRRSCLPTGS